MITAQNWIALDRCKFPLINFGELRPRTSCEIRDRKGFLPVSLWYKGGRCRGPIGGLCPC